MVVVGPNGGTEPFRANPGSERCETGRRWLRPAPRHNPADVRPQTALTRCVRVSLPIGVRVVHAMGGGPFNRTPLKRQRGTRHEEVFDGSWDFVTAVRKQTVISHADAQTTRDPVEQHRGNHRGPTPEPESREGAEMEEA